MLITDSLVNDIFKEIIFPALSQSDLVAFGLVCKRFHELRQSQYAKAPYPRTEVEFSGIYTTGPKWTNGPVSVSIAATDKTNIQITRGDAVYTVNPTSVTNGYIVLHAIVHTWISEGFLVPTTFKAEKVLVLEIQWPPILEILKKAAAGRELDVARRMLMYYLHLTKLIDTEGNFPASTYRKISSNHHFLFHAIQRNPTVNYQPHVASLMDGILLPVELAPEGVQLFDFQEASVRRFRVLESRIMRNLPVGKVDQSINFWLGPDAMHLNINTGISSFGPSPGLRSNEEELNIYTRGLMIADGTGLGKTTLTLVLALGTGPLTEPPPLEEGSFTLPIVEAKEPTIISPHMLLPIGQIKLFYTRASLIYIKKELLFGADGWVDRAQRMFPNKRVIVIADREAYESTSYMDIAYADLVIVTNNLVNGALMSVTFNAMDQYTTGQYMSGGVHPATLTNKYLYSRKPNDTAVHLGLFLWQRIFIDEAHEAINLPMPADYNRFLSSVAFAHVKYYISATPWAMSRMFITKHDVSRFYGDFLGLYVAPKDTLYSVQTLRKQLVDVMFQTYVSTDDKEEVFLPWTNVTGPDCESKLRFGLLAQAINKACLMTIVSRNTETSVIREVSLARVNQTTVHVPVPELFFILDATEEVLGIKGALQVYVTHTKKVSYRKRKRDSILVKVAELKPARPDAAVNCLVILAQSLVDCKFNDRENTYSWNPVTISNWRGDSLNTTANNMTTFIQKTFTGIPTTDRFGPFVAAALGQVQTILDVDGTRVLIATKHRVLIHALQEEFSRLKIEVCVLGATNTTTAKKNLKLFNDSARVMILHATKAASGLNLQTASHLLLLDDLESIKSEDIVQLPGRLKRIGQKRNDVSVIHMIPQRVKPKPAVIDIVEEDDEEEVEDEKNPVEVSSDSPEESSVDFDKKRKREDEDEDEEESSSSESEEEYKRPVKRRRTEEN